jgi:outer membrane protein assembly factor BamB
MKVSLSILIPLTFLAACSGVKDQKNSASKEVQAFKPEVQHSLYVEYDNINDPQKMHVVLDRERLLVDKSGTIYTPDGDVYADLDLGGSIQVIYMWEDGPELTVLAELSDGDNGWTEVEKLNVMQKKKIWSTRFGGFNAGVPIIANGKMYLSTHGALGKLDISTGHFCWKIENLFDGSKYNGFEEPVFVNASQVLFRSDRPFVEKMDEILVDDLKGTVVRKD